MPLINCPDCSNQISNQASRCPKCGWIKPKFKLWIWIPLSAIGLFAIVIIIGSMQPEYKSKAIELRKICEKSARSQFECDQIYHNAIADGKLLEIYKSDKAKGLSR